MSFSSHHVAAPQVKHNRRRSLIPTPSTGTSRKASPTLAILNKPLPQLPRSESMLPYSQRAGDDLSGIQQQLNVRNFSIKSLAEPDEVEPAPAPQPARPKLPKSKTSVSFSSHIRRQTIPDRHLLKPVLPPLPHSQSLGNASCFTTVVPTPSPARLVRAHPLHVNEPSVTAADAIHESRMTAHEIEVLNQVQKEASRNRNRFRSRYSSGRSASRPTVSPTLINPVAVALSPTSSVTHSPHISAAVINKKPHPERELLTINTELANSASIRPAQLLTQTCDGQSGNLVIDPKHVYFAQDQAYWLGRYVAICDRLRSDAMIAVLSSPRPARLNDSPTKEMSYDVAEKNRKKVALEELRVSCKSMKALQSFQVFEAQLMDNVSFADSRSERSICSTEPQMQNVASSSISLHSQHYMASARSKADTENDVCAAKRTRPDIPLPNIFSKLTKSKTTNNIAAMMPTTASFPSSTALSASRKQSTRPTITVHNRRKSSATTASMPSSIQSTKPATLKSPTTVQGESANSQTALSLSQPQSDLETPRKPPRCHCRTSSFSSGRFDEVAEGITASILESGHSRPPSPKPAERSKYKISVLDNKRHVEEKFVRSSRPRQRRSSGEVMKEIWETSAAKLRKIKERRVGGSSVYMSSGEDLHAGPSTGS